MTETLSGLDALYEKSNDLTVAFIGGSITEGTDRADPGKYYVDNVGNYFKNHYKNRNVQIINAGWGGTGSEFGLFRLYDDVSQYKPDLVFIEFAVNDLLLLRVKGAEYIRLYLENIVQNLCSLPKKPVIIFIYTTDNQYRATIKEHNEIAEYYNIPVIDINSYIKSEIEKKHFSFEDIFGDSVHPNNFGYEVYSDFIISSLFENREKFFVLPKNNKDMLCAKRLSHPRIVFHNPAMLNGGWKTRPYINKHLKPCVVSSRKGDKISYEFNGNFIGVLCEELYDLGSAEYTLDDTIKGAITPTKYLPAMINNSITAGSHKIEIEVTSDTPFCFAGFLVNEV